MSTTHEIMRTAECLVSMVIYMRCLYYVYPTGEIITVGFLNGYLAREWLTFVKGLAGVETERREIGTSAVTGFILKSQRKQASRGIFGQETHKRE